MPPSFRRGPAPTYTGSILAGTLAYQRPVKTPYQRGRAAERRACVRLKRQGYATTLTPFSGGAADIWARRLPGTSGPSLRLIQVKLRTRFEPSALNDAVRTLLRRPTVADQTREAWLTLGTSEGWIVEVVIDHRDMVTVRGKAKYADAVRTALRRAVG